MKRFLVLFAIVLGLLMMSIFAGCNFNTLEKETYVVETGIVSNDTVDTAFEIVENIPGQTPFSNFCIIRDYLYKNTATDNYEIERDVTFEELKSMQMSCTEGPEIANCIKEYGFYLGAYYRRKYSSKKIWISVTKTGLLY